MSRDGCIVGGVTNIRPEAGPMLIVDCPLCECPAPLDAESTALDCAACGVRLELAVDSAELLAAA
jgi:hypothetical protein